LSRSGLGTRGGFIVDRSRGRSVLREGLITSSTCYKKGSVRWKEGGIDGSNAYISTGERGFNVGGVGGAIIVVSPRLQCGKAQIITSLSSKRQRRAVCLPREGYCEIPRWAGHGLEIGFVRLTKALSHTGKRKKTSARNIRLRVEHRVVQKRLRKDALLRGKHKPRWFNNI